MKEIEKLIKEAVKCISKSKEYFNKEQGELLVAITAAEAVLKRAKVYDGYWYPYENPKLINNGKLVEFPILAMNPDMPDEKKVRIIVIPEVENGK